MNEETFTTNIGGCDPSDCASCTSDCAGAGQAIPRVPNPTIKLTLEDDSVLECAVLTTFDVEGFGEYIALIPLDKNGKNKSGETFLFRYHEEDGNPVINNIEREEEYMDVLEDGAWQRIFKEKPEVFTREEKRAWLDKLTDVTLGSDAFFPFSDNIERAHKSGVKYIAEPGGSVRDDAVIECCNKYNMAMAFTGIRLFHH